MKKNISIKEIANLSGVSVATVSRVLNNNGRFSEETRQKVLQVVKEHNYQVNSVAQALRSQRSKTIGMIIPDISNSFFAKLINKIESILFTKGYSTIICTTDKDSAKETAYLKALDAKLVDGLICISGQEFLDVSVMSRKIPIVCIDRNPNVKGEVGFVQSDNFLGGSLAAQRLLEQKCQNIVIVSKENSMSSIRERVDGAIAYIKQQKKDSAACQVLLSNREDLSNYDKGIAIAHELVQLPSVPDGIFATNDWMAWGIIQGLKKRGILTPRDVKVVGYDNDQIGEVLEPTLTSISQNIPQLAEDASMLLLNMIQLEGLNKDFSKKKIIPVELKVRGSA